MGGSGGSVSTLGNVVVFNKLMELYMGLGGEGI